MIKNFKLRPKWDTLDSRIHPVCLTWAQKRAVEKKPYYIAEMGNNFTALDYAKMRHAIEIGKPIGLLINPDYDFSVSMIRKAKIRTWRDCNLGTRDSELKILEMYMKGELLL